MMNLALMASECSKGCESGWTMYLEHSFLNQNASHNDEVYEEEEEEEDSEKEEEEDLSMVSDASSGPAQYFPDDEPNNGFNNNGCFCSESDEAVKKMVKSTKKKKKKKPKAKENIHHLPSFLDDTASSPLLDLSMKKTSQASTESVVEYSQGFSATYFEERSSFQDHFALLQPSLSENELQNKHWFGWKRRGKR